MKQHRLYWKMSAGLAAALALLGGASAFGAAALGGYLTLRPLTQTEISKYSLTNPPASRSGGLTTVGVGEPVYLEALVTNSLAANPVTNVTWTLASQPPSSTAALQPSFLGANVPVFNPADASIYQVAGRQILRPDQAGSYTVNLFIAMGGSGSTNPSVYSTNLTVHITAGIYLGISACEGCHNGTFSGVPDTYQGFTNTEHATFFTLAIQGLESTHYSSSCIQCHTVGYDANNSLFDGGFNDEASLLGWTFPTAWSAANWTDMPEPLQNLGNIQCENCHGPGMLHQESGGITGNTNAISISYGAGDCAQCHDDLNTHYYYSEWTKSGHANMTRTPSGTASRIACVRCHTTPGFIQYCNNLTSPGVYATNYSFEALTCQGCHDPHSAANPFQLRTSGSVTLADGTVVTNAGVGSICFNCHTSRNGSVTNSLVEYPALQTTWNGGSSFGTHDSPQADMLEGVNAVTYGQVIASAPHASVVSNTCVGCHMQTIASTDPAFTKAGGHSTLMTYNAVNNGVTNVVSVTYACTQCHGALTNFNLVVPDSVGYGYAQGIQTQVQILLNQLSMLLPPSGYKTNAALYVADGLVKSPSTQTNWPLPFLQAAYNWQFVNNDGSLGVHNGPFAIGLLKASIANLTGVSTPGGLPDSWETTYFGPNFVTNALALPDAVNNSAGVPNWMMYALGLSPTAAFNVGNSGVLYFNGQNVVNGATNAIAIYTAAQISFNTVPGYTYQIQGITALTGSWQNISTNIPGTGGTVSYLTPTRGTQQMFFRVVSTP